MPQREDLILELLKNLREENNRRFDQLEDHSQRRLSTLESKVDDLFAFRWRYVGGSLAVSAILAFGFNIIHTFVK